MKVHILTLFPEVFESVFTKSIIKRAQDKKILEINLVNIRDWGQGKHHQVDDKPYGGGSGMVMMPGPIISALKSIKVKPYVILLSASGQRYTQKDAKRLAGKKRIAIICGRYEGIDARVEKFTDETFSTGDYILTGGEIPAMILVDSITRLIPGTIDQNSLSEESFTINKNLKLKIKNLLEYPQFTRPKVFSGLKVPKVLLSGNHKQIQKWRLNKSIKRTKKFRPDLTH